MSSNDASLISDVPLVSLLTGSICDVTSVQPTDVVLDSNVSLPKAVETASAKKRRKRKTPEEKEDRSKLTIAELVRDRKHGIPTQSSLLSKKKGRTTSAVESKTKDLNASASVDSQSQPDIRRTAPRVQIVDGKLVLDQSSLTVATNINVSHQDYEFIQETHNHVTSASFTTHVSRTRWTKEETELFYKGLQAYGTDFMMISTYFPNRTRDHIKLKYKREEKSNPTRLAAALSSPIPATVLDMPISDSQQ